MPLAPLQSKIDVCISILFSMKLSSGRKLKKKDSEGKIIPFKRTDGEIRFEYIEFELQWVEGYEDNYSNEFDQIIKDKDDVVAG